MKKCIFTVGVLAVALILGVFVAGCASTSEQSVPPVVEEQVEELPAEEAPAE